MVLREVLVPLVGFTFVCIWTGVLFFQNNAGRFAWLNFPVQIAIVVVLCAALWLSGIIAALVPMLFRVRWSIARALSVWTIGIFFFFSHEAIRNWLIKEFDLSGNPSRFIYVFIVTGALVASWHMSRHKPARVTFAITAILLSLISFGAVLPVALARLGASPNAQQLVPEHSERGGVIFRENVYYVILDGYGGPAALRKYLGLDIGPFLEEMNELGYVIIDSSRANYTVTYASLAATLNANYIATEKSQRYSDRGDFFPGSLYRSQPPLVVRKLRSMGYDFIHIGNGWAPCHSMGDVACLSTPSTLEDVFAQFMAPTKLIPLVEKFLMPNRRNESDALMPLSSAIESVSERKRPSFFFVHNLIPHDPLHVDCSRSDAEVSKGGYVNSIKCVNNSVLFLAQRIRNFDPNAIVVFQADHGSGFGANWADPLAHWGSAAIDERTSILNLVHVPESCRKWMRPNLSPINTMRFVMGCLERRAPDYLVERSYLVAYETSPDFGIVREVTNYLPERTEGMVLGASR